MFASDLKQQRPDAQQHEVDRDEEDEEGLGDGGQHGNGADEFQAAEGPARRASESQRGELGTDLLGAEQLACRPGNKAQRDQRLNEQGKHVHAELL